MKIEFREFYKIGKDYRHKLALESELKKMCEHCRKRIYNRLSEDLYFCGHHKTPIKYYENCAYFKPIWAVKL